MFPVPRRKKSEGGNCKNRKGGVGTFCVARRLVAAALLARDPAAVFPLNRGSHSQPTPRKRREWPKPSLGGVSLPWRQRTWPFWPAFRFLRLWACRSRRRQPGIFEHK